jgi:ribosomal protein L12E/L44/L45/RPP1/RPP2
LLFEFADLVVGSGAAAPAGAAGAGAAAGGAAPAEEAKEEEKEEEKEESDEDVCLPGSLSPIRDADLVLDGFWSL